MKLITLCANFKKLASRINRYIESVSQGGKNPQAHRTQNHLACFCPRRHFNKVPGWADPSPQKLPTLGSNFLCPLSFFLQGKKTFR